MSQWVRLCSIREAPEEGKAMQVTTANGVDVCLARLDGELRALDNWCPHRRGPLGEGWVEGGAIVCPWHAWAFDLKTGVAHPPERASVEALALKTEGDDLLVDLA
ncbi:Rieske (2Fe-2S) protein [Terriglobus albidus]|uniref:Rieske (2Fe-2S) protein n=1 Tax=Terriglobus albidus TaxID=1592106 RepID=A0A5B9EBW9_9BACT|nr:Rieske (2Fe-2S) protein [Terriglobus albidus]QEE29134.1 Rieske (2Fe-2S) protein [Terriglobus albidus]